MPRTFVAASTQRLTRTSSPPATGTPCTIAGWINPTSVAAVQAIGAINRNATSAEYLCIGVTSLAKAFAESNHAGTAVDALGTTTITVGKWWHICGVFTSATSRDVYTNGLDKQSNTTSNVPVSIDTVTVGSVFTGAAYAAFAAGSLAHVAFWNTALPVDQIQRLANGLSPLRINPAPQAYIPIWGQSPETDMMNGTGLTLSGSPVVITDIPPMFQPNNNFQSFTVGDGMWTGEKIR